MPQIEASEMNQLVDLLQDLVTRTVLNRQADNERWQQIYKMLQRLETAIGKAVVRADTDVPVEEARHKERKKDGQ
ncbi:hypothetical protein DM02DRAFT_663291 [Periconia macrospinosa]|uniref:Uncharacterized protein n=1 Tax=Periconia macrospinosa TaxID=97972 RepID=A0A2V1D211_9PLEO|nr:hypothetical protein DM02DRAFT_663291 [Periconia macrospinosa]